MNPETERKYALKYIPEEIQIEKAINIEQCFIYSDGKTIVRLRRITNLKDKKEEYIYTVKTNGNIELGNDKNLANKYEIESNISKEVFEELKNRKISNVINKTRVVLPIKDDLRAEIDIYYGYLENLLTVEVEFKDEEQAEKFIKPDWFGDELGYRVLSNRKLSEMTREEFESKVTKEFLEKNKNLIKELEEKIWK